MQAVRGPLRPAAQQSEHRTAEHVVLNLLNEDWGRVRVANPAILEHVAQTPGAPEESVPVFRYDTTAEEWTTVATESAFQLQLAARYRF